MEISAILSFVCYFSVSMLCGLTGLNAPQVYRPALLAVLILTSILAFRTINDRDFGVSGTETLAMFVLFYISHMTCALCLEEYVLPKKVGASMDWRAAYKMLFNARFIGTIRQAPDITSRPKKFKDEESSADSSEVYSTYPTLNFKDLKSFIRSPRGVFLRNRVLSLLTIHAIDRFYQYLFLVVLPQYVDQITVYDLLPSKHVYFRRLATVTLRETLIRTWMVCYWTWSSYSLYVSLHDALAFIFVGIGLDEPEDWPPLFGKISDATSIRGFWGKFWHRLVYRSYTSYGKFIATNIIRFPRNSMLGKLFINGFVFLMSGLVHAICLKQMGFSCGASDEVQFYFSHFVAILAETALQFAFKKLSRGYKVNNILSNTVGYLWVFGFLFYSVPKSQYPKIFCLPE